MCDGSSWTHLTQAPVTAQAPARLQAQSPVLKLYLNLCDEGALEPVGDGSPWSSLHHCLPPARLPPQAPHQVGMRRKSKIPLKPTSILLLRHDKAVDEEGREYIIVDL